MVGLLIQGPADDSRNGWGRAVFPPPPSYSIGGLKTGSQTDAKKSSLRMRIGNNSKWPLILQHFELLMTWLQQAKTTSTETTETTF